MSIAQIIEEYHDAAILQHRSRYVVARRVANLWVIGQYGDAPLDCLKDNQLYFRTIGAARESLGVKRIKVKKVPHAESR